MLKYVDRMTQYQLLHGNNMNSAKFNAPSAHFDKTHSKQKSWYNRKGLKIKTKHEQGNISLFIYQLDSFKSNYSFKYGVLWFVISLKIQTYYQNVLLFIMDCYCRIVALCVVGNLQNLQ